MFGNIIKLDKQGRKDLDEFITKQFNVDFSIDRDTYRYGFDLDWIDFIKSLYGNKKNQLSLYSCVKMGENFYILQVSNNYFTLSPIDKSTIIKVEKDIVNVSYEKYEEDTWGINLLKDLTDEWIQFRKEKISQNNIEL